MSITFNHAITQKHCLTLYMSMGKISKALSHGIRLWLLWARLAACNAGIRIWTHDRRVSKCKKRTIVSQHLTGGIAAKAAETGRQQQQAALPTLDHVLDYLRRVSVDVGGAAAWALRVCSYIKERGEKEEGRLKTSIGTRERVVWVGARTEEELAGDGGVGPL